METPEFSTYSLAGQRFVALAEADFLRLCRVAGVEVAGAAASDALHPGGDLLDQQRLRQRIRARRLAVGLTQGSLAKSAGIRVETLNRIERGRSVPDFRTIRKLVAALRRFEETATGQQGGSTDA